MNNISSKTLKLVFFTLITAAMAVNIYSQELPETDIISTDAGDVKMSFIGHGSLMFRVNDFVIHIDPVKSSGSYRQLPKADLILVTHEHYDHLDKDLIADLRKEGTIMFCNGNSAREIPWANVVRHGESREAGSSTVEAVPAYNVLHERVKGQPFHPKGVGNGYILTIGGKRFYIAGDTENIPEMKSLKNIYVAFLPMNLPYTMTPEMVADAAIAFQPEILYPYHFSDTDTSIIVKLLEGTGIDVRIRNLN